MSMFSLLKSDSFGIDLVRVQQPNKGKQLQMEQTQLNLYQA